MCEGMGENFGETSEKRNLETKRRLLFGLMKKKRRG